MLNMNFQRMVRYIALVLLILILGSLLGALVMVLHTEYQSVVTAIMSILENLTHLLSFLILFLVALPVIRWWACAPFYIFPRLPHCRFCSLFAILVRCINQGISLGMVPAKHPTPA